MDSSSLLLSLNEKCSAFRSRLKLLLTSVGCLRLLAFSLTFILAVSLADWWFHFPSLVRWANLTIFVSTLLTLIWYTIARPLQQKWSNQEVLTQLEKTQPHLLSLYELVTAQAEIPEEKSPAGQEMMQSAVKQLTHLTKDLQIDQAFTRAGLFAWMKIVAVGSVVLIALAALLPSYTQIGIARFFMPFSALRWPHRTTIAFVTPLTGWAVPQLEPFVLEAEIIGEIPNKVVLAYRLGDGPWVREKLMPQTKTGENETPVSYHLSHIFPEVRENIELTLEGGDYLSDLQKITVIHRPFLKNIAAHYSYPTYVGLPDRTIASGQLNGLEGTQVRLVFSCSLALEKAVFILKDEQGKEIEHSELTQLSPTDFEKSLTLERSGHYSVELYEKNGYREARPETYEIRVTPDDLPEIELLSPGKDLLETNQATIDVAFRVRDKLGLAKVEFLQQLNDEPPTLLSDRITGPIPQTGLEQIVRFQWDLRKMTSLPESGQLRYVVRVQDNNPTGRGKVESLPGLIKIVKPSEFHLEALERAKILEEEARIAWRNQLLAWKKAEHWLDSGTGAEDDPVWLEMSDAQQKSITAGKQLRVHFQNLTEKHQRNHLGQDFMAGRLSVIGELIQRIIEVEHAPLNEALSLAKPRTGADALPDKLKVLRQGALAKGKNQQKLALLALERLLRKLYDWRDLQTCTVTSKLLHEQQEEVLMRTQQIAPKTIAKEVEDLKDADLDKVLTLGKQQRAIYDTETGLETQLTYLMYKAERQARKTILEPLQSAFANLRNNRVNFHLKRAAELIENNQPAQIIDNQKSALRALQVVLAGLVQAGQKIEADDPLSLTQTPTEESAFDPDQLKPTEIVKQPDKPEETKPPDATEVTPEIPTLPEGTDALSASIRLVVELQDNVLARTKYLDNNRGADEMPRFLKLKVLRLLERQDLSLTALDKAALEAEKKSAPAATEILKWVQTESIQVRALLASHTTEPSAQAFQADMVTTLKDLLQQISFEQHIEAASSENKRLNGVDAFQRKYIIRDRDLDLLSSLVVELSHLRWLQADILRKCERWQQFPAVAEPMLGIEKTTQTLAANQQTEIIQRLGKWLNKSKQLSQLAQQRADLAGLAQLKVQKWDELPAQIETNTLKNDRIAKLKQAIQEISTTVQNLRDLLEEREPEALKEVVNEPAKITPEQMQLLTSREHLAKLLKDEASLPPELREKIILALEKDFTPKYRELLQSYYSSFVTPKKAEKK